MKYVPIKSLYVRMFFAICAAAIPLLAGSVYYIYRQTELLQANARSEARQYLDVAAEYAAAEIRGTGETLSAIAATPIIQGHHWQRCDRYFSDVVQRRPDRYSNIGVIDLHGNVLCSGVTPPGDAFRSLADRPYFRLALKNRGLVVGDYQRGRLTEIPSIVVARAIYDADGQKSAVLFAALRLTALEHVSQDANFREAHLAILDRGGRILTASDSILGHPGDRIVDPLMRRFISTQHRDVEAIDQTGVPYHLIGSAYAGPSNDPSSIVVLYASRGSEMLANLRHGLWGGAVFALLLILLSVSAGWAGTNALIGRNIRRIAEAATRLRERRFESRVADDVSGREFKLIAVQLDEMAKELAQREQQWQSSVQRQAMQVELLRRIAQNDPLDAILASICEFAEQQIPDARACLLIVDEQGYVTDCIAPQLPDSFRRMFIGQQAKSGAGSCGTAITERRAIISDDIASDDLWVDYRGLAMEYGLHACWSYPIISAGNRVFGSFALYFKTPKKPGAGEFSISQMGAELAAVAIDRHTTGEALSQSEAEYRSLFESNPYPMWVSDTATGKFLAVNTTAVGHYGFSKDELLGMREADLELAHPADSRVRDASPRSRLHRNANGDVLEVETTYFPLRFQGREASLALVSDVTYRSSLTKTISDQNALFSLLMNSTVEAIYGVDKNGCCTFANAACERLLGYAASELVGRSMHRLIHHSREVGQPYPLSSCRIHNRIDSNAHIHLDDEVFWRKDGRPLPVEYWAYPIVRAGTVTGSIVTFIDTTERRRQQDELRRRATFDGLTGLLNRASFVAVLASRLERAASEQRSLIVALLDLDGFKEVNDHLGHSAGDQLLGEIAARLAATLGATAEIGRIGGDEFVFVMDGADEQTVIGYIKAVLESVRQPFSISGLDIQISGSVGAATFPGAGSDVDTLLRSADAAMYAAKREGCGVSLTDRIDAGSSRPFLMSELRRAMQDEQFLLHFQPKVSLQGRRRIGFEALLRWKHPALGLVGPCEYMPMLELSDLIHPLTEWVIESAVTQFVGLARQCPHAFVSVNVSMRNLLDLGFSAKVRRLLDRHDFPAHQLKLEVTESTLMSDPERTKKALDELHAQGVRIAIDDFGTGYSSLSYLQKLPVDDLKIDRSFVMDMSDSEASKTIVRSIISLAHSLGITVTAEGIETEETLALLRGAGCDFAQGYFIGRPMPFDALLDWIDDSDWCANMRAK
ncbi:EAL domain-containing protein [Pandoraea sp.]|uniref:EAL domain-containing protein n=1 Tax=Pandoraea sp. TaxID=1883445 RepID=UPI0025FB51F8|nr:EAL domain-containing protein [Pandoraea sp.]